MALGGNECRDNAGAGHWLICDVLGTAMAWNTRRLPLFHQCGFRLEVAPGVAHASRASCETQAGVARRLGSLTKSNGRRAATDPDLRCRDARVFMPVFGARPLSERRVRNYRKDYRLCLSLRGSFFRSDAIR